MTQADLDKYVHQFTGLSNRDTAHDYKGISLKGAPHQPLVLLVVLDLYAHDPLRHNFLEIDGLLLELWRIYLTLVPTSTRYPQVAMPLYALRNEPFWHLVPRPGATSPQSRVRTAPCFNHFFVGVILDDTLHQLLRHQNARLELRRAVVETYFPRERWLALQRFPKRSSTDKFATSAYAERLLVEDAFGRLMDGPADREQRALRDASFRKAVTFAYDYRCAFCGVRLRSRDTNTVVEAAHIIPWSETHDDRPVNGLCLCPLCHWAFDAHMLAIDTTGTILTHTNIQMGNNLPGHLSTFSGRRMFPPRDPRFNPDPNCVQVQLRRFMDS